MSDKIKHRSRTARTYDELRDAIVDARYPPGDRLLIDQISKDLSVSSGAIREALSRLTAEGLVVAEPQKGFVVAPISRQDLIDLTEVRVSIETQCLRDSILKGNLDWEGRLLSAHHRLNALGDAYKRRGSSDANKWHQWHQEFHDQLTAACDNQWWLRLRRQLYIQSERYRRLSGPADESDRDIVEEHAQIASAALARDVESACGHMNDHLTRTTKILIASAFPFANVQ